MEALLHIEHLNKAFGSHRAVSDLSLSVNAGEVFGFLGPNGAGKTTTIKMIMGFLTPDSGSIRVAGYDHKKQYTKAMGCLGGIVENPEMFKEFSGRRNIEMYARLHGKIPKERIDEVIELVGMTERQNDIVKRYSLGMKQRIGLAQALVHKPKVLILDEPTNGLDPTGIKELREILVRLAHEQGVAVMVSSHQLFEMQMMCDRVGMIERGRMLGVESVETLMHAGASRYRFRIGEGQAVDLALGEEQERILSCEGNLLELRAEEEEVPALTKKLVDGGIALYGIERVDRSLEDAYIRIMGGEKDA